MGEFSFKTPDLGEGIVEVELIKWHIRLGDDVKEDQPIADVLTDKANVEITSPVTGMVIRLACDVDDMAPVGSELVRFEVEDAELQGADLEAEVVAPEAAKVKKKYSSISVAHPIPQPSATGRSLASPAVRRRALELGLDINSISGSGPKKRITHADLDCVQHSPDSTGSPTAAGTEQIKLTGLRRVIAQKMQASRLTIPHFSYVEEVDMTELESLRLQLNAGRNKKQKKLTLLPFLMKALALSLEQYPQLNATFNDETGSLTRYNAVHIGIAIHTDQGLKVPVVRHVESLDIWSNANQLHRLTWAARKNTISHAELTGSTITVSNLGKQGGIASTPIVNKPEVAIIGVNRAQHRVVVRDGQMVIRYMMNISSSFDHRIIDGHVAAGFIQTIKLKLENPAMLFIP